VGKVVRIGYVIGSLDLGGAEKHLSTVVPALPRDKFAPVIYVLTRKGDFARQVEETGVAVLAPPLTRSVKGDPLLFKILQIVVAVGWLAGQFCLRRPRIVHFFLPESYLIGAPLAFLTFRPVRVMSRRSLNEYQRRYPGLAKVERMLHKTMARVVGNSKAVVDQLIEAEGVPREKCVLIYNGHIFPSAHSYGTAEWSKVRWSCRRDYGLSDDELVIVMVANLIAYKGHIDLIRGLGLFEASAPGAWRVLLAGRDDGIGSEIQKEAERLGIGHRIILAGAVRDVTPVLAAADIGVLTSHQEGFSNAVIEYMAAGLPVIATDVGGNAEAVVDGTTGLTVQPRDPEGFAKALAYLADDPERRQAYGEAGRRRVESLFSMDRCVGAYVRLYEGLVGTNERTVHDKIGPL